MNRKTYNGWLASPNIAKRSLAAWGHVALIQIPLTILLVVLLFAWLGATTRSNVNSSYQPSFVPTCTTTSATDCLNGN